MSVPKHIEEKIGKNLHLKQNHPINTVYGLIRELFPDFLINDDLPPVVSIEDNFDSLRIPKNHPSRSASDSYYIDDKSLLRTHTSAHQVRFLKSGCKSFLVCGDVYRKDDIDATHYPVFHQLEGVKLCSNPADDLKNTLSLVIKKLFGDTEFRFKEDYFPFTHPSWEVEVNFNGKWLEILGCGVIHPEVWPESGWAFGLGLERLAMILFDIPDIRLFWSEDQRFANQFSNKDIKKFKPYSNQPVCYKDIAFWISDPFNEKDMLDITRDIAGNLVEDVVLKDTFEKNGRRSRCYRFNYRDYDRVLTNREVDEIQIKIRESLVHKMKVVLR